MTKTKQLTFNTIIKQNFSKCIKETKQQSVEFSLSSLIKL